MAIRSGFFNSVNGDRKYDASRFAEYFASFIGNGVFLNPSDGLQVIANNDMTVTVKAGKCWINGYIMINDDDYILEIEPADGVLNRIDRVVARYDVVDREIRLEVKKGTFASNPVAPELQRDEDAYELALADIRVNAGATSISQDNITDLRDNKELCGWVDSLIAGDVTALAAQLDKHKAEKVTSQNPGHAQVDGDTIQSNDGVISVTEGKFMGGTKVYGTAIYTDTLQASATITKSINIGAGKKHGILVMRMNSLDYNYGVMVFFGTDKTKTKVVGYSQALVPGASGEPAGSAWTRAHLGTVTNTKLGRGAAGTIYEQIVVNDVYIEGDYLKIVFTNSNQEGTNNLNCRVDWEVW